LYARLQSVVQCGQACDHIVLSCIVNYGLLYDAALSRCEADRRTCTSRFGLLLIRLE
jgi:hypothetical protein